MLQTNNQFLWAVVRIAGISIFLFFRYFKSLFRFSFSNNISLIIIYIFFQNNFHSFNSSFNTIKVYLQNLLKISLVCLNRFSLSSIYIKLWVLKYLNFYSFFLFKGFLLQRCTRKTFFIFHFWFYIFARDFALYMSFNNLFWHIKVNPYSCCFVFCCKIRFKNFC